MGIFEEYAPLKPSIMPPKNLAGLKKIISQGQFVTSSGLPSFDNLLGGGLVVGSSTIFIEDMHRTYIRYFLKLFAAQGLTCHHKLCYISPIDRIESFVKDLPGLADYSHESSADSDHRPGNEGLDVAWRYKNITPISMAHQSSTLSHEFDLTKTLDLNELTSISELNSCEFRVDPLANLETNLEAVLQHIAQLPSTGQKCVNRIMIDSIASPMWGKQLRDAGKSLSTFMVKLRLLLRDSFNVVYITIPKSVVKKLEPGLQCMTYADYVFELEGFDGRQGLEGAVNPLYQEYNGLLTIRHLPSLSRLNLEPVARPLTFDWAFKVKRRQFFVQHLNLPPCLSDNASRTNTIDSTMSCGFGKPPTLDF